MSKKIIAVLLAAMATTTVIAGETKAEAVFDADNNGTLSQEEAKAVPGLTEQWKDLDVNADGQLDPTEFAKFVAVENKAPAK